ncbi:MAG: hypothetical protein QG597_2123 [Actinomycetota bacterium]|nr:hypothetical protein [Actinomycetota bacterium]
MGVSTDASRRQSRFARGEGPRESGREEVSGEVGTLPVPAASAVGSFSTWDRRVYVVRGPGVCVASWCVGEGAPGVRGWFRRWWGRWARGGGGRWGCGGVGRWW